MTYSNSELIERLLDAPMIATEDRRLCAEAADRIAELEAKYDDLQNDIAEYLEELRREK